MRTLVFDCEATTFQKGNPFSRGNRLMCVGTLFDGKLEYWDVEHSGRPYGPNLAKLTEMFNQADLIVGFNLKYDLHWIRKYCPAARFLRVFDCQLAQFVLDDQQNPFPSLAGVGQRYGLAGKLDTIAVEYWDQGIDTPDVPLEILQDRVLTDVKLTDDIYQAQLELIVNSGKARLLDLQMADLLVLQEMEYNGLFYDSERSLTKAREVELELAEVNKRLYARGDFAGLNFNSGDHLSAVLYGGAVNLLGRETTYRTLKSGAIKVGERNCNVVKQFPRLIAPLDKTESLPTSKMSDEELERTNEQRKQEGKKPIHRVFYTNETVLRSLGATGEVKQFINDILRLAELDKLRGTSYQGIPELISEMAWDGQMLHGQLNQCVARTGRLSSSKPNLQNFAGVMKELFVSRYATSN